MSHSIEESKSCFVRSMDFGEYLFNKSPCSVTGMRKFWANTCRCLTAQKPEPCWLPVEIFTSSSYSSCWPVAIWRLQKYNFYWARSKGVYWEVEVCLKMCSLVDQIKLLQCAPERTDIPFSMILQNRDNLNAQIATSVQVDLLAISSFTYIYNAGVLECRERCS
jgi:hypothetical protein